MEVTMERLAEAYKYTGELIDDVYQARNIFFEEELRRELEEAYREFKARFFEILDRIWEIDESQDEYLVSAGLVGAQKTLKLKSFAVSYNAYRTQGSVRRLVETLKKAKTILASLGGAVPFVGSFIQELIEFLLGQLERKS